MASRATRIHFALLILFGLVVAGTSQSVAATGDALLTHGPVVGAVTAEGARVFVRTDTAALVQIKYGVNADLSDASTGGAVSTTAESDYTAHVPLTLLQPNTRYYIDVLVDGVSQLQVPAQFKTFPTEGSTAHLKLVMLTDFGATDSSQPPLKKPSQTFDNAARENPDLVFLGGDMDHRDPRALDDKRQMFKDVYGLNNPHAKMDVFVTEILRKYPVAHHWDDHDYSANDASRHAPDRQISQQVFREYFPAYPFPSSSQIYQRFHFGNVEFFILDNRSQRDPNPLPDSPTKSMLDGEHLRKLGQLRWLLGGLSESDAHWKIIFSSSVFNPTIGKVDSWHSFRHEHDRIVNYVRSHDIRNVLVISGDIHAGAMDDGTNAGLPEMVVPGANLAYCYTVPQTGTGLWTHGTYGDAARNNNDIPCNGYGVLKLSDRRAKFTVKDQKGQVRLEMVVRHRP